MHSGSTSFTLHDVQEGHDFYTFEYQEFLRTKALLLKGVFLVTG